MVTDLTISPNGSSPEGEGFPPSPKGTLSAAQSQRLFYEIDCSPHRLDISYQTLKISADLKTFDMSDESTLDPNSDLRFLMA
jgi:hypothetical protein